MYNMNKKKFSLKSGEVIQVFGRARVHIISGGLSIFGKIFEKDSVINVPIYRGYPAEAQGPTVLEIEYISKMPEYRNGIGTKIWEETVDKFVTDPNNVLVIGGVDTGKTGLTKFITNRLIYNGYKTNVIDLDPGQGDIGLPSFIGGAHFKQPIIDLDEASNPVYRFVGSISPLGKESIVERSAVSLYETLPKADCTIYNLHGWIMGCRAITHIYNLIKLIDIGSIFYLSDARTDKYVNYLFNFLRLENTKLKLYILPKANVLKRTRYRRKKIRELKYLDYINKYDFMSKTVDISLLVSNSKYSTPDKIPSELLHLFTDVYGLDRFPDALLINNINIKFLYQSNNISRPILWYRKGKNAPPATIVILPEKGHGILSALVTNKQHLPIFLYGFNLKKSVVRMMMPTEYIYYTIEYLSTGRVVIDLAKGKEVSVLLTDLF